MSEQTQGTNPTMQEVLAELAALRTEFNALKNSHSNHAVTKPALPSQPGTIEQPKSGLSSSRRRMLRRILGGLVARLAAGGLVVAQPQGAKANSTNNPTTNGLNGRAGMLVTPPGATVTGTLSGGSTKVGLVVNGDATFDVSAFTPTVNAAILAYTANNGSAIVGQTQTGTAVYGQSNTNYGVVGHSTSGMGVYGESSSSSGVSGNSVTGTGVVGTSSTTTGIGVGVYGTTSSATGYGVYGIAANPGVAGNTSYGVYGYSASYNGYGVYGRATSPEGMGVVGEGARHGVLGSGPIGVYATGTQFAIKTYAPNSTAYAGYFDGKVQVTGVLSKGAGSFKIDHPADPENKFLYHSFVESPDMMNIYNGLVTLDEAGEAVVTMPDWFEMLNTDFRYQLTSIGASMPDLFIGEEMQDRTFKIAGGKNGQRVSWQVTGIRQDAFAQAHRIPVEQDKTEEEKGKFLHPELFGQPKELAIHFSDEVNFLKGTTPGPVSV